MNFKERMYEQLAIDLACTVEEIKNNKNVFKVAKRNDNMRRSENLECTQMHLICINNKMVARCPDERVINWLEKEYSNFNSNWLGSYHITRKFDEGLKQFGIRVALFDSFFIPNDNTKELDCNNLNNYILKWYNSNELKCFKDDKRFVEALLFYENAPDMIALTASKNEDIVAMAAANADRYNMWQMGINVVPEYNGQGIATALVAILKNRIIELDVLPYYSTAISHVVSQKVSIQAGFIPAFTELVTMTEHVKKSL